jgi:hypothetical protein
LSFLDIKDIASWHASCYVYTSAVIVPAPSPYSIATPSCGHESPKSIADLKKKSAHVLNNSLPSQYRGP